MHLPFAHIDLMPSPHRLEQARNSKSGVGMRKKPVNKVMQEQREKADDDRGLHLPFHVASEQSGEECDNKLEKKRGERKDASSS